MNKTMLLAAIAVSGSLSTLSLASLTFEWVGPKDAKSYYPPVDLHSAAPVNPFPTTWILVLLVVGIFTTVGAYKLYRSHKSYPSHGFKS